MKSYIAIYSMLMSILTVVGCQKSTLEDDPSKNPNHRAINFATNVAETRARVTYEDKLKTDGFFVNVFVEDEAKTPYFSADVTHNGTSWSYGNAEYWPVEPLTFYGYSPKNDFIEPQENDSYSDYSLQYTCPGSITEQVDIVASRVANAKEPVSDGAVEMEFNHVLSSIKFEVEISKEKNVTLNEIRIGYIGIEKQRSYNFDTNTWSEPATPSYFSKSDELFTSITLDENKKTDDPEKDPLLFDNIDEQLMIIPQPIQNDKDFAKQHYITVQVTYWLNAEMDNESQAVQTGVMVLPSPNSDNEYKQGELYTYNLKVNGQEIVLGDVSITDKDEPDNALGNIDLKLITESTTFDDSEPNYYNTTALRVEKLLEAGVRDFVVVGSLGVEGDNLGNGKLGYYGSDSSPFTIGARLAGMEQYGLYSVDLRGTYDYPEFQYGADGATSPDIGPEEEMMISGLFMNVKGLREVILPYGLKAIGVHSFAGCEGMTSIDIADVKHIEIGAFQKAYKLETVIGDSLTRIHENGFDECLELVTIDLSNVTRVDESGFVNCRKLTDVDIHQLNVIGPHAFDGCWELTLKAGTKIPGFIDVATYAFANCKRLGEDGSHIDLIEAHTVAKRAFVGCEKLLLDGDDDVNKIANHQQLTTIGVEAFNGCKRIGEEFQFKFQAIETIDTMAFANCEHLNIIDGLQRLDIINDGVFMGCTRLLGYDKNETNEASKFLSLPKVTSVGESGFQHSGITDVRFTDGTLTSVGNFAFNMCSDLVSVSGTEQITSTGINAFANCPKLERLVLNELTSDLCEGGLFYNSPNIKELSLPLLTENDASWYYDNGNESTTDDYFSATIIGMISKDNIESVDLRSLEGDIAGWQGLNESAKLHTINIASLNSLGNGMFQNCSALRTVDVSSATYLGVYSFQGCVELPTIDLPKVLTIGESAFQGCTTLETVNAPVATTVGVSAFNSCEALKEMVLPKVVTFGDYFLGGCTKLQKLEMNSLEAQTPDGATQSIFEIVKSVPSIKELRLPSLNGEIGGWKFFCTWNTDLSDFNDNNTLCYMDLSSIVKITAGSTFAGLNSLESLDLRSVTEVSPSAFDGCTAIKRLNLSGLKSYDDTDTWAFSKIPDGQCELWISDEIAAEITGTSWAGVEWAAIHKVSDNVTFNLVVE